MDTPWTCGLRENPLSGEGSGQLLPLEPLGPARSGLLGGAVSCLLNNERLSERKQENWKLRTGTLTFPPHPPNVLVEPIILLFTQRECLARPSQTVRLNCQQIGFLQEDFLHFPLVWSLRGWLKASAGTHSLHKMNLRRNLVLLPTGLDL